MKTLALLTVFAVARPGYRFEFPRDHGEHRDFKTEWWYYTGNLEARGGRRFGFELTFFRQAAEGSRQPSGVWDPADLYLAHAAFTDVAGRRFHHFERVNRRGPGLAGAAVENGVARVWNGNWEASPVGLRITADTYSLDLRFRASKPPVIHGEGGVSQKARGDGRASHYVSYTRLEAGGSVTVGGERVEVTGLAWMDHEFFTHQLEPDQTGWDWMSIQLADNTELMLFRLRRRDGSIDPYSAGTFIDAAGRATRLDASRFRIEPLGETWKSQATGAVYPLRWRVSVPGLRLSLEAAAVMPEQELASRSRFAPSYWEGAMDYRGESGGRSVTGRGYLEMTGYDKAVTLGR